MQRHWLFVVLMLVTPFMAVAHAADDSPPVMIDFSPVDQIKGKYGFDYDFTCLDVPTNRQKNSKDFVTGTYGSAWFDPTTERSKGIRDRFLKDLAKDGYVVEGVGDCGLLVKSYQGMPLQQQRIKFKVRLWDDKTQKGAFEPIVSALNQKQ
jgi:hypothetical protein